MKTAYTIKRGDAYELSKQKSTVSLQNISYFTGYDSGYSHGVEVVSDQMSRNISVLEDMLSKKETYIIELQKYIPEPKKKQYPILTKIIWFSIGFIVASLTVLIFK